MLLANGCDLKLNRCNYTPLHSAAATGRYEIVKILIEQGMEVNKKDYGGYTPLHWATQERHLNVINLLIEMGGEIESKDENGATPLYIAASEGYTEIVEYYIAKNANVDSTYGSPSDCTPLNIACVFNNIDAVELLLKNKADIEAMDDEGRTPLFNAALRGNIDVVKLLLKYGANKNVKDKKGKTIQDIRRSKIKEEILNILQR
jgi:ankyrin repeat protein